MNIYKFKNQFKPGQLIKVENTEKSNKHKSLIGIILNIEDNGELFLTDEGELAAYSIKMFALKNQYLVASRIDTIIEFVVFMSDEIKIL